MYTVVKHNIKNLENQVSLNQLHKNCFPNKYIPSCFKRWRISPHLLNIIDINEKYSLGVSITHSENLGMSKGIVIESKSLDTNYLRINACYSVDNRPSYNYITIVDNKLLYENKSLINKINYRKGENFYYEKERILDAFLKMHAHQSIETFLNGDEVYIVLQKNKKLENIKITDEKRLVELIGIENYIKYFDSYRLVYGYIITISEDKKNNLKIINNFVKDNIEKEDLRREKINILTDI